MDDIVRGKNEKCQICYKKFTMFTPEHICKRCMRSVCKECADTKTNVYEKGGEKKPHRLCSKCVPESQFLENYKTNYKISLGTNSKIGLSWAEQLNRKRANHSPIQITKFSKQPLKPKNDFWASLNFSLRNFFGVCIDDSEYYIPLNTVYNKCNSRRCSPYLSFFLLCHLNETKSAQSMEIIYDLLLTNPPELQNIMNHLKFFGFSSQEIFKIRPFVESLFERFTNSLSLNIVSAEVSLFIIEDYIKTGSPIALEKGLASAINCIKDYLLSHLDNRKGCEIELIRSLRFNAFEANMKILAQKVKLQEETAEAKNSSILFRASLAAIGEQQERTKSTADNDLATQRKESSESRLNVSVEHVSSLDEQDIDDEELRSIMTENEKLKTNVNNLLRITDQLMDALQRI